MNWKDEAGISKRKLFTVCLLTFILVGTFSSFLPSNYVPTIPMAKASILFEDGFESGNLSEWTGTYTSPGETVSVSTANPYYGTYHMRATTDGSGLTEYAYAYKTITEQSELYTRIYLTSPYFPNASNDNIQGILFYASGTAVAQIGLRYSGGLKIAGSYRNGVTWTSWWDDVVSPSNNTYYCYELYWIEDGTVGKIKAWFEDELVYTSPNIDSNDYGGVTEVRVGGAYTHNITGNFDVDCVVIADEYIGAIGVPLHSNVNANCTIAGQLVEFVVKWTSLSLNLSHGIYGTNNTGTWENETAVALNGTVDWLNVTKTLNSTVGVRVEWRVRANNTAGKWGDTGIQYLITQSSSPPQSSYETTNSTYAGRGVQLSAKWTGQNLVGCIFGWNNSGTSENDTWVDLWSGTPNVAWMYINKTLNSTVGLTIEWQAWVNNSISEWGTTGSQTFVITETNISLTIVSPTNTTYSGSFLIEIEGNFIPSAESYNYSVTADSGYHADIQDAVDDVDAHGGGAVYIPEGTFNFVNDEESWTGSRVIIPAGIDLLGAPTERTSGLEYNGTGQNPNDQVVEWKTILQIPWEANPSPDRPSTVYLTMLEFQGSGDPDENSRVSDIKFVGYREFNHTSEAWYSAIKIWNIIDFRIDHCFFKHITHQAINIRAPANGNNCGVIDHCRFVNDYGYVEWAYDECTVGYGVSMRAIDTTRWEDDITKVIGHYTSYTVFIEDCYFRRWRHCACSNDGYHYVFRHNTIQNDSIVGSIDGHGSFTSGVPVGTRAMEIYNNTIIDPVLNKHPENWNTSIPASGTDGYAVNWRGGGGVFFNNYVRDYRIGITMTDEGSVQKCYPHNAWIWDNTWINAQYYPVHVSYQEHYYITEDVDYFLRAPNQEQDGFEYTPYPYPHPLTIVGGGSGVEAVWYNIKYLNGSWYYVQNQTYTESIEVQLLAGLYSLHVWGNNTFGDIDSDTVWFTIHGYFSTKALANYNTNLKNSGSPYIVETTEVITALNYLDIWLNFTVNASSGVISTTQICTNGKGNEFSVIGTPNWSLSGNTITLNATHGSEKTISIQWVVRSGGRTRKFSLKVFVVNPSGVNVAGADVLVKNSVGTVLASDITSDDGVVKFNLKKGTYLVEASKLLLSGSRYVDLTENMEITIGLEETGLKLPFELSVEDFVETVEPYVSGFVGLVLGNVLAVGFGAVGVFSVWMGSEEDSEKFYVAGAVLIGLSILLFFSIMFL